MTDPTLCLLAGLALGCALTLFGALAYHLAALSVLRALGEEGGDDGGTELYEIPVPPFDGVHLRPDVEIRN